MTNIETILVQSIFAGISLVITVIAYKLTIGIPREKWWRSYN